MPMRRAMMHGVIAGLMILALPIAVLLWVVGGPILDRYFPVIGNMRVSNAVQHGRMVGFDLTVTKFRQGTPIYYSWFAVTALRTGIPLPAFKGDPDCTHELKESQMINHTVRFSWTIHYCFRLPETVIDNQAYSVQGQAGHMTDHGVRVEQLPEFTPKIVK